MLPSVVWSSKFHFQAFKPDFFSHNKINTRKLTLVFSRDNQHYSHCLGIFTIFKLTGVLTHNSSRSRWITYTLQGSTAAHVLYALLSTCFMDNFLEPLSEDYTAHWSHGSFSRFWLVNVVSLGEKANFSFKVSNVACNAMQIPETKHCECLTSDLLLLVYPNWCIVCAQHIVYDV